MRVTIIRDDGTVGIDGRFVRIDLSGLPETLRVIQWHGETGWIEWRDQPNEAITSIAAYQGIIDIAVEMIGNPFFDMTLQQKQSLYRHRINAEHEARKTSGVQLATVWYPSGFESMFIYLDWKDAARDMLAAGATVDSPLIVDDNPAILYSMDGVEKEITIKNCINLVDKCRRLVRRLDRTRRNHIEAMLALPDPIGYDYTTGWPERYQPV